MDFSYRMFNHWSATFSCNVMPGRIRDFWDAAEGCIDAPEDIPAGSTLRIDPRDIEPFATPRLAFRDGWMPRE